VTIEERGFGILMARASTLRSKSRFVQNIGSVPCG